MGDKIPVEEIKAYIPSTGPRVDIRNEPEAFGWQLIRDWFAARQGRPLTAMEENNLHDYLTGWPTAVNKEEFKAYRSQPVEERRTFMESFEAFNKLFRIDKDSE